VFEEDGRQQAIRDWMKARIANINKNVTAADVLSRNGVSLHKNGGQEEQISCPFHGTDTHPSARYFPEANESPSHVWCFACHKRWDAIGLWKQFNGEEKFSELLFHIERAFGLKAPEFHAAPDLEDEYDPVREEVEKLFDACENRLRQYRKSFDMVAHLKIGSLLDQLRFNLEQGALPPLEAQKRLTQILAKIGQIVRASQTHPTKR
jgi:hypothetical protein